MNEAEESLAAELAPSGSLAWQRLHGDVSSQLMVDVLPAENGPDGDGARPGDTPGRRSPPRRIRRRARRVGDRGGSARRRAERRQGRARRAQPPPRLRRRPRTESAGEQRRPGDARRDDGGCRRVAARLPPLLPRQGARCSATTAGCPGGSSSRRSVRAGEVTWDDATELVGDTFAGFSPDLAGLATRAFDEQWVDAEIRDGKRGGAYCAGVDGDVSRVMMNFDGSLDSVSTLAHELGHAYHNVALADRTPMQRRTADGVGRDRVDLLRDAAVREHGRAGADDAGGSRSSTCTSSADAGRRRHPQPLPVRVRAVPAPAAHRASRCRNSTTMMLDAQEAAYGDGLAPRVPPSVHVGREAALLHAVLQLAVHVRPAVRHRPLRQVHRGPRAVPRRLRRPARRRPVWPTPRRSPAAFGFDVRDPEFWASSLAVIRRHIDDFEGLVDTGD